jgi:hypothetical protein
MGIIYNRRLLRRNVSIGITNTGLIRFLSGADESSGIN